MQGGIEGIGRAVKQAQSNRGTDRRARGQAEGRRLRRAGRGQGRSSDRSCGQGCGELPGRGQHPPPARLPRSAAARHASACSHAAPARCKHRRAPVSTAPSWVTPKSTPPAPIPGADPLFSAADEIQEDLGRAGDPCSHLAGPRRVRWGQATHRGAEQEQRMVAALSLHPGSSESDALCPGHYHHEAPPPSCAGLGAGWLRWKLAKELPEATVIWNR